MVLQFVYEETNLIKCLNQRFNENSKNVLVKFQKTKTKMLF